MNGLKMYQLLEKIGFTRTGGSKEELQTAHLLLNEITNLGGHGILQPFGVNAQIMERVSLVVNEPNGAFLK